MTDHPEPGPRDVLPSELASRLLARASELDVAVGDGPTVAELRAAAESPPTGTSAERGH